MRERKKALWRRQCEREQYIVTSGKGLDNETWRSRIRNLFSLSLRAALSRYTHLADIDLMRPSLSYHSKLPCFFLYDLYLFCRSHPIRRIHICPSPSQPLTSSYHSYFCPLYQPSPLSRFPHPVMAFLFPVIRVSPISAL